MAAVKQQTGKGGHSGDTLICACAYHCGSVGSLLLKIKAVIMLRLWMQDKFNCEYFQQIAP